MKSLGCVKQCLPNWLAVITVRFKLNGLNLVSSCFKMRRFVQGRRCVNMLCSLQKGIFMIIKDIELLSSGVNV